MLPVRMFCTDCLQCNGRAQQWRFKEEACSNCKTLTQTIRENILVTLAAVGKWSKGDGGNSREIRLGNNGEREKRVDPGKKLFSRSLFHIPEQRGQEICFQVKGIFLEINIAKHVLQ